MKIAYFGFDLFYDCLEYLSKTNEIIKIFTCKVDGEYEFNTKTYELARSKGIEITDSKITREMISELEAKGCELIISAGYYFKIPVSEKIKAINIHPSHLPEGRGPWPLPIIILRGLTQSAVTAHVIADSFDAGDIIHQLPVRIEKNENLETLTLKMQKNAVLLLRQMLSDFYAFWDNKKAQVGGSYWPEPTVKDMSFTDDLDYSVIDKIVRAFYGFRCYFETNGKTLCIKTAVCVKNEKEVPRGSIRVVSINGGYLCILSLT